MVNDAVRLPKNAVRSPYRQARTLMRCGGTVNPVRSTGRYGYGAGNLYVMRYPRAVKTLPLDAFSMYNGVRILPTRTFARFVRYLAIIDHAPVLKTRSRTPNTPTIPKNRVLKGTERGKNVRLTVAAHGIQQVEKRHYFDTRCRCCNSEPYAGKRYGYSRATNSRLSVVLRENGRVYVLSLQNGPIPPAPIRKKGAKTVKSPNGSAFWVFPPK